MTFEDIIWLVTFAVILYAVVPLMREMWQAMREKMIEMEEEEDNDSNPTQH